jgi:flavin reductase (DIM6/NTAB) family NADH-FMN oxidoreductase RutF
MQTDYQMSPRSNINCGEVPVSALRLPTPKPSEVRVSDRESFLLGMRSVANSVAVVTTDGPAGRHGATVSSFCSVSAVPPSLLVCLNSNSRIAPMVQINRAFCVNVLTASATQIADRFAGRTEPSLDRFRGLTLLDSAHPAPILDIAACAFSCDAAAIIPHGTHLIVVGHVVSVVKTENAPLTYLNGQYGVHTQSGAND